jgi:hypothetical protein
VTVDRRAVTEHFCRLVEESDAWKEKASCYYKLLADIYHGPILKRWLVLCLQNDFTAADLFHDGVD